MAFDSTVIDEKEGGAWRVGALWENFSLGFELKVVIKNLLGRTEGNSWPGYDHKSLIYRIICIIGFWSSSNEVNVANMLGLWAI